MSHSSNQYIQLQTYERLRAILADKNRGCVVFCNEHFSGTYVERQPNESPNDRNDRAIRKAAWWYSVHLEPCALPVIMLSNDRENREKATAERIRCLSVQEFVDSFLAQSHPDLVQQVSHAASAGGDADAKADSLSEHLSPSELEAGIASNRLFRSKIRINRNFWAEGWVKGPGQDAEILIKGPACINRAMDGDEVVVELLHDCEWATASTTITEDEVDETESGLLNQEASRPADEKPHAKLAGNAKRPTGKVVGILSRNWRQYCGSIQETHVQEGNVLFIPMDPKFPKIRIHSRQVAQLLDKRIVVVIDSWPRDSKFPLGHYVKTIGVIGDRNTETQVLMLEHGVTDPNWSDQILCSLPPPDYQIPLEEIKKRLDLRQTVIFSIDPPGCKDIDDALHLVELPNGNFEIGVHIADVSHFIESGSALDLEASDRATSVYLTERRIDMLPQLLSTNMCSLIQDADRLTFSVLWEITPDAQILSTRFHKTVIHSQAAMTYAQAQDFINRNDIDHVHGRPTILMNQVAKKLRAARIQRGALTLASPAVKFVMDSESDVPLDLEMYQLKETNALVEEFMLLANISVADFIVKSYPQFALLRRHPTPVPSFFEPLHKSLGAVGFAINSSSSLLLAQSLDQTTLEHYPYFNTLVRILATRCMTQAIYFCSGDLPPQEFAHYGLAADVYTHFTSPIRRYADIVVHRLLAAALDIASLPPMLQDREHMRKVADGINHRHRMAQLCGRASVNLHTVIFFREKRVEADAVIMAVKSNGIVVLVPKYGMESPIRLVSKDDSPSVKGLWQFDETAFRLSGPDGIFQIFDRLRVVIYVEQLKFHRYARPSPLTAY